MMAGEINILSAGAVAPGLKKFIELFQNDTGESVNVTFATAPAILERLRDSTPIDIVIGPPVVLHDAARQGKISPERRVLLGRIGAGVMVRAQTTQPPIATVEQLKKSLLDARSLVFNRASTGTYLENLFEKLGIAPKLERKSIRYPDFAAVLDHIRRGENGEIGFGATTVIVENAERGVAFVGALPAEIQNYTAYEAAVVQSNAAKPAAHHFIEYLGSSRARAIFAAVGIDS
jgi:molybdate transport system substrate-binding protein